jgi:hypothetical protein
MSLHLKPTMSKNQALPTKADKPLRRTVKPDNHHPPLFRSGDKLSVYVGDRLNEAARASFPPVKRHIWSTDESVNTEIQKSFTLARGRGKSAALRSPRGAVPVLAVLAGTSDGEFATPRA